MGRRKTGVPSRPTNSNRFCKPRSEFSVLKLALEIFANLFASYLTLQASSQTSMTFINFAN